MSEKTELPITRVSLLEAGFTYHCAYESYSIGRITYFAHRPHDKWYYGLELIPTPKTRSDVLDLVRLLVEEEQ